jgi:Fe2+ transport system protein FeoA
VESQIAIITNIKGEQSFKSFLLSHGIVTGTVFSFNYSPKYSGLVNITMNNRMISIRKNEFNQIEWQWKK